MRTCPKCGAEYNEGVAFCSVCGEALSKKCVKCGASMDIHDNFCKNCGFDNTVESATSYVAKQQSELYWKQVRRAAIKNKIIITLVVIAAIVGAYFLIGYVKYLKRVNTYGYSYVDSVILDDGESKECYRIVSDIEKNYIGFFFFDKNDNLVTKDSLCYYALCDVCSGARPVEYKAKLMRDDGGDFDLQKAGEIIDDSSMIRWNAYRMKYEIENIFSDFSRQELSFKDSWITLYPDDYSVRLFNHRL